MCRRSKFWSLYDRRKLDGLSLSECEQGCAYLLYNFWRPYPILCKWMLSHQMQLLAYTTQWCILPTFLSSLVFTIYVVCVVTRLVQRQHPSSITLAPYKYVCCRVITSVDVNTWRTQLLSWETRQIYERVLHNRTTCCTLKNLNNLDIAKLGDISVSLTIYVDQSPFYLTCKKWFFCEATNISSCWM